MMDHGFSVKFMSILTFAAVLIFNLPWIIPDLIYGYKDDQCVTFMPNGFLINLSIWLQADAYLRVFFTTIILLLAIGACNTSLREEYERFNNAQSPIIVVMLVLTFSWMIVGQAMFWGRLNPTGLCTGGLQVYMFVYFIISNIVSAIIICIFGCKMSYSTGRKQMSGLLLNC